MLWLRERAGPKIGGGRGEVAHDADRGEAGRKTGCVVHQMLAGWLGYEILVTYPGYPIDLLYILGIHVLQFK